MAFKAILQALRGGQLKFIDVTINFFAYLQTLKVTCTYAWKNNIGWGAVFYLSI